MPILGGRRLAGLVRLVGRARPSTCCQAGMAVQLVVMVISKKNCTPACNIVMNGTILKQVHKFNYLGSLITSDGRCINEIRRRMAQAKASFQNMKRIVTNKRLSLGVRKRVLQCYIEPILLYGCESWSLTNKHQHP